MTFIFVTIILDTLGFGITIPVLPTLIRSFSPDPAQGTAIFGLLVTIFGLMQFLFSPLIGVLSDRYGRRPVLILSGFGLGVDYMIMALAPNLEWFFVGRILSGITSSSYATAAAYVADVTPVERRAAAFGMVGAMWGIGFILGPAIGGVVGEFGIASRSGLRRRVRLPAPATACSSCRSRSHCRTGNRSPGVARIRSGRSLCSAPIGTSSDSARLRSSSSWRSRPSRRSSSSTP